MSGKTGQGIPELIQKLSLALSSRTVAAGLATHVRHRIAMESSLKALKIAVECVGKGPDHYDIAAEEIRTSIRSLEALIGRIDVENLLDEIFSSFCLGK